LEQSRIDMFVATMSNKFPSEKLMSVRERLENLDDSRMVIIQSVEYKDPTTMLIISLFLGTFGVDRFMLGDVGMGILKLLTFGLCGVLTIIDWFNVQKKTKEKNLEKFMSLA